MSDLPFQFLIRFCGNKNVSFIFLHIFHNFCFFRKQHKKLLVPNWLVFCVHSIKGFFAVQVAKKSSGLKTNNFFCFSSNHLIFLISFFQILIEKWEVFLEKRQFNSKKPKKNVCYQNVLQEVIFCHYLIIFN